MRTRNRTDRVVDAAIVALILLALLAALSGWSDRRDALHCARTGPGTDQSIADCYTTRRLQCPTDICGAAP